MGPVHCDSTFKFKIKTLDMFHIVHQKTIDNVSPLLLPCDLKEKDIILNSCICKTTYLKHKRVNVDSFHY